MKRIMFKSALRKRIEMKISELEVSCDLLQKELKSKGLKRPTVEYAKYWIRIKDMEAQIKMLKELL